MTAIGAVILSGVMAWLSFRYVERPFRLNHSHGFGRPFIFRASIISLAVMVSAGWFLYAFDGLPTRLPTGVSTLAAFAQDRNPRREECFRRSPSEGLCAIGLPSKDGEQVDFLFWGDSHADAIMPGMDLAAKSAGQRGVFAGKDGCPPLIHVERFSNGDTCTSDFSEEIWAWLKSRPDVQLVVLGARWPLNVEGTRPKGEAGTDVRLKWTGDHMRNLDKADNAELVETGLRETVAAISATGRQVVLLGPVPEIGRDVPNNLARAALFGWTPGPLLTRREYDARAGRTEQILSHLAETNKRVHYLSLTDLFCDQRYCRVKSPEGFPLYVDSNHIGRTAAQSVLAPRLGDIWKRY